MDSDYLYNAKDRSAMRFLYLMFGVSRVPGMPKWFKKKLDDKVIKRAETLFNSEDSGVLMMASAVVLQEEVKPRYKLDLSKMIVVTASNLIVGRLVSSSMTPGEYDTIAGVDKRLAVECLDRVEEFLGKQNFSLAQSEIVSALRKEVLEYKIKASYCSACRVSS